MLNLASQGHGIPTLQAIMPMYSIAFKACSTAEPDAADPASLPNTADPAPRHPADKAKMHPHCVLTIIPVDSVRRA